MDKTDQSDRMTPQPRADVAWLSQVNHCPKCNRRWLGGKMCPNCDCELVPGEPESKIMETHQIRPDVCRILGLPFEGFDITTKIVPNVSLDQYKQAIRVRIAELEGFENIGYDENELRWIGTRKGQTFSDPIPDYPNSLDACREIILKSDKAHELHHRLTKLAVRTGVPFMKLCALNWCEEILLLP